MRSRKVRRKSVHRKGSRKMASKKRARVSRKKSKTKRIRRSTIKKGRKKTRKRTTRKRMRGGALDDKELKEILSALIETVRKLEVEANLTQRPPSTHAAQGATKDKIYTRWMDKMAILHKRGRAEPGSALDDKELKEILSALIETVRDLEVEANLAQRPPSMHAAQGATKDKIDTRWIDKIAILHKRGRPAGSAPAETSSAGHKLDFTIDDPSGPSLRASETVIFNDWKARGSPMPPPMRDRRLVWQALGEDGPVPQAS